MIAAALAPLSSPVLGARCAKDPLNVKAIILNNLPSVSRVRFAGSSLPLCVSFIYLFIHW